MAMNARSIDYLPGNFLGGPFQYSRAEVLNLDESSACHIVRASLLIQINATQLRLAFC